MKHFFTFIVFITSLFSHIAHAQIIRPEVHLSQLYLRDIQGKSPRMVQRDSFEHYKNFVLTDVNSHHLDHYRGQDINKPRILSKAKASIPLYAANRNPVVSSYSNNKYDPYNVGIGFCFGRAMFVHLYLSINGFNRSNIKKAFVVGPMNSGGTSWAWHVTTIVQSKTSSGKETWLALDPIMDMPLEVSEWYERMLKISSDGKLRLYITEAGKFSDLPSRYDETELRAPFYNNYFKDMMRWFADNDVSKDMSINH